MINLCFVESMLRLACAAVLSIAASHNAHGEVHPSVTTVISEGDVIDGRTVLRLSEDDSNIAINDAGEIAFHGEVYWNGVTGWGVMTNRRFVAGAGKVIEGIVPVFNSEDQSVDINDSGNVAYTARDESTGLFSIFVDESRRYRVGDTVDGVTIGAIARHTAINDSGTVVFSGFRDRPLLAPGEALWAGGRVHIQTDYVIDGIAVDHFEFPRINNAGEIATGIDLQGLDPSEPNDAIVTPDSIVLRPGDVVDDLEIEIVRQIGAFLDNGTIVANVNVGRNDNGQRLSAIVTQHQVLLRPGDIVDGVLYDGLLGGSVVGMNNRQQLAFLSWPHVTGVNDPKMLFAAGQLIAVEGDVYQGKTIASLKQNFDLNDNGQLAFRVTFTDGTDSILLATVPEPTLHPLAIAAAIFLFRSLIVRRSRVGLVFSKGGLTCSLQLSDRAARV